MVSINELARIVMDIAGKRLSIKHIPGPLGVRGRNSDNELIGKMLDWKPRRPLREGLETTYRWIEMQVSRVEGRNSARAAE
jgi:nucleoside-diphosphate-sugar epimerase